MSTSEPALPVCRACGTGAPRHLAAFGSHPISSRFRRPEDPPAPCFPLAMSRCPRCGSVQLTEPVPLAALEPVPSWLRFSEPGAHLPAVVDALPATGASGPARVLGLGPDDVPLLTAIAGRGARTWQLDWLAEGATSATPRPAAVHAHLTPAAARAVRARHGGSTLILARYLLEHAPDAGAFLDALAELLDPGGAVLFEVPDCTKAFATHDYTTLWEEHVFYFTPGALQRALAARGWRVLSARSYDNPLHNALVVVAAPGGATAAGDPPAEELALSDGFAATYGSTRDRVAVWCERQVRERGPMALFGAGHVGLTFLVAMGIAHHLSGVIDDSPAKQDLLMPGTALRISSSESLGGSGVSTLLMAVNPASETAVLERLTDFTRRGGHVASIFPGSTRALPVF